MINILEAYLHIMDGDLVISDEATELDTAISDYIDGHIMKHLEAMDTVCMPIAEGTKIFDYLEASKTTGNFSAFTKSIAEAFWETAQRTEDVRPGVLACVLFDMMETTYFGLLKLNFKTAYFHAVTQRAEALSQRLAVQNTMLPGKQQRIEEAFVIDLDALTLYLKDKEVLLDGKKAKYISECILGTEAQISTKKVLDILSKAAKTSDEPLEVAVNKAKVGAYVSAQLESGSPINVTELANACFESETERQKYETVVRSKGVQDEVIEIHENQNVKLRGVQKIKTEAGVEITLPEQYLIQSDNMEVIRESDGTLSIKLRHIGAIL